MGSDSGARGRKSGPVQAAIGAWIENEGFGEWLWASEGAVAVPFSLPDRQGIRACAGSGRSMD